MACFFTNSFKIISSFNGCYNRSKNNWVLFAFGVSNLHFISFAADLIF